LLPVSNGCSRGHAINHSSSILFTTMLLHFENLTKRAAIVSAAGYAAAFLMKSEAVKSGLGLPDFVFESCAWIGGIGYFAAFWAYAKAKGRSGALGLLLALFFIVGIIIIRSLSDESDKPADIICPACSGKNEPVALQCRYCQSQLAAPVGIPAEANQAALKL
jgi:hypothetical protein